MLSGSSTANVNQVMYLPVSLVSSAMVLSIMNERNAFPTRFITSMNTGFDGETVTSSIRRNYRTIHASPKHASNG